MKRILLSLLAVLMLSSVGFAAQLNNYDRVQDQTGTLSAQEVNALKAQIDIFERKSSNQLAVVIVPNLDGKDAQEVSYAVASKLGIGKKDKDNGILVFMAMKEKKIRIEVGRGLEGAYPDIFAKHAIDSAVEQFKKKNFFGGLSSIVEDVAQKTSGEFPQQEKDKAVAAAAAKEKADTEFWYWVIGICITIFLLDLFTAPWKGDMWSLLLIVLLIENMPFVGDVVSGFGGGGFGGGGSGGDW